MRYRNDSPDTASKCETRHTDIIDLGYLSRLIRDFAHYTHSTANYSDAVLLKFAVELAPSIAWPDIDALLVIRNLDLVQLLQSDGDTALNTGRALECSMTATLHSERTPGKARDKNGSRDLLGIRRLEDAVRIDSCLLCRPVRPSEGSVIGRLSE
jgi:hypothetical protein